jgi:hypothetical protein
LRKDAKTISVAGLKVIMTARNTFTNNRPEFNFEPTPLTVLHPSPAKVSKWLISIQAISIAVTAVSFASVGAVYAWNVHVQKNFDQQYRKLETLKQSERQLIVANESLGHDLITNLDRLPVKLIREKPQQSIFIVPAAPSPIKAVPKDTSAKLFDPLGY